MPDSTLLLCTVGGSHEPILTAVRQGRPEYVCFVCSEDDPTTGKPGSWTQIERAGMVIKAHPKDDQPSLPNIPAQLDLPKDRFEVLRIPADDLDAAGTAIRRRLGELRERFPESRPIADYTGGTKTMTAALVVAALEEGVELQLVTGGRADLVRVGSGMESVFSAPTEQIRIVRAMAPFRAAWRLAGTIPGPAAAFVETQLARLQDHVKARNRSILAHGYDPISAAEWTRFAGWLQESFMPLLESEAAAVGVRGVPEQLPTGPCWRDAGA